MHPTPTDDSGSPAAPSLDPVFLPLHTSVVLLAALVIGLIMGGLTALTGAPVAGAVLAGLVAAGPAVPALRALITPPRDRR
ncbi:hypothetical protein H8N01_28345 [Streptomyces sp. AC536]|uniref:hypothetical protein n=1 Tax=Streptomyces buecherae TaxID=2763006 RepID=UPI00164E357B|nr:hypothetical protein [Streptomyces buecherae]MBC3986385.1 hypothetical protein [Streptomyces buecherae]QNJ41476.1 hypothetical protein H7H31_18010 [Streptomyces buecherae]